MEHVREIGRAVRFIADDLDKDQRLQEYVVTCQKHALYLSLLIVSLNVPRPSHGACERDRPSPSVYW